MFRTTPGDIWVAAEHNQIEQQGTSQWYIVCTVPGEPGNKKQAGTLLASKRKPSFTFPLVTARTKRRTWVCGSVYESWSSPLFGLHGSLVRN